MIDPEELFISIVSGTILTVVFILIADSLCGSMEEGQPFHDTCQTVSELGIAALLLLGTVSIISVAVAAIVFFESSGGR